MVELAKNINSGEYIILADVNEAMALSKNQSVNLVTVAQTLGADAG